MIASLRPAIAADLDELSAMRAGLYEHNLQAINESRDRRTLLELIEHPELGFALLIQRNGKTVGYAIATFCYSIEFAGRFALLDELWIAPEHRGQSIGREAIKQIEQMLAPHKIAALRLEVEQTNPAAKRFYTKCGFTLHDRRLMTRWL